MAYLEMRGITKIYKEMNILANDNVNLSIEKNEIHAVIGENGAGKSTLMKILHGLEHPDEGEIYLNGKKVSIRNPMDANKLGIGMVHQHFRLINNFTVAENIVLGIEPRKYLFLFDRAKTIKTVKNVMCRYGFDLDPELPVAQLAVGQMQLVEILKILYREADLLILDEPTSVLTEQGIQKLFNTIRNLKKLGKTIIIITHKLKEVKEISDRVTVMRKGKIVTEKITSDIDKKELSRLMIGKSDLFDINKAKLSCGLPILQLKDVTLIKKGQSKLLLDKVNLTIRSCEIVGVAGVGGNGLEELEDVVTGLRRISSGEILHKGNKINNLNTVKLRDAGFSYVPADRLLRGSSLNSSIKENMIISGINKFQKGGIINKKEVDKHVQRLTGKYSIEGDSSMPLGTLSGGNIQKVILARELSGKHDFIVFSEPTWGLDVANSEFIYNNIMEMREKGTAILLISSNIDEILFLSDRIVVMYSGRVVANLPNKDMSKELIGEYMLGIRDDYPKIRA